MAQLQGVVLDPDRFCCSICLDLLKEPVSLPCGHSCCKHCIDDCWALSTRQHRHRDTSRDEPVYYCPQCRERFRKKLVLSKNSMLAEVVETLRKARPSAAVIYAGPADVPCDFCSGTRRPKALKCCLSCLASYCKAHLQPHYSVPVLQKHKLVPAAHKLQEKMCSVHSKLKEAFCRTDQLCVCYLCAMEEHKGHDTVSAAAEKTEKQKQLATIQENIQQEIQERKKELMDMRQVLKTLKSSAEAEVLTVDAIFSKMIASVEKRRSEVKKQIGEQQKSAGAQTEEHSRQLEKEIAMLQRKHADLGELSKTDDTIHFIQRFQSLSRPSGSPALPSVVAHPLGSFTDVGDAVSELIVQLYTILETTWPEITKRVSAVSVLHKPSQPQTSEDLQDSCTLDVQEPHPVEAEHDDSIEETQALESND